MNKERVKVEWFVISILLIVLILSIRKCSNYKYESKEQANLVSSLNDTIKTWKDKNNLSHSKIEVIETINPNDFIKLKSKDEDIQKLQQLVSNYKSKLKKQGSATIFETTIEIEDKVTTKVDSIVYPKDGLIVKKPVYNSSFNLGGWVVGSTKATEDSTQISLKVRNEYSVIIGEESQGWFKSKKPFVEIINQNPYSETKSLRTYQVQLPKPKYFGVGPIIGYGISTDFKFQPFIGIGVQYNLIKF